MAKVQFALTGGSLNQTVVGTAVPSLYGYLFSLNTTTIANGTYSLESVATDTVGNTGYSPGVQVTVNNPPPTTSIAHPFRGAPPSAAPRSSTPPPPMPAGWPRSISPSPADH